MRASTRLAGLAAAAFMIVAVGAVAATDPAQVIKERQDTMKRQGDDMKQIKGFIDGKADLAAAQKSADDLTHTTARIPDLFPPGTDQAPPGGKYRPKADIWKNWNQFLQVQENADGKAKALAAAAAGGDKAKIAAAFGDLGKNGCGGCHEKFREKVE
jgi:cytochrome c556